MKKSFLLFALALGAVTMNAQITYVTTLSNVNLEFSNDVEPIYIPKFGEFVYSVDNTSKTITIYNDQFEAEKVVSIPNVSQAAEICVYWASKGLFTTDDKICFMVRAEFGDWSNRTFKYMVLNENGIVIESFKEEYSSYYFPSLFSMNGNIYVAFTPDVRSEGNLGDSDLYSLPCTTTDFDSPAAPIRQAEVQKVVENGQMYLIFDGIKYAVSGSEV